MGYGNTAPSKSKREDDEKTKAGLRGRCGRGDVVAFVANLIFRSGYRSQEIGHKLKQFISKIAHNNLGLGPGLQTSLNGLLGDKWENALEDLKDMLF